MNRVAIIGGGPAGMMAAISAAQSGYRVDLYDKNSRLGQKLLLTGGGRCNVAPAVTASQFVDRLVGPVRFIRPAVSAFGPADTRSFFESGGVALKQEGAKLYPVSDQAGDILACLLRRLDQAGVQILLNQAVTAVRLEPDQVLGIETDRFLAYDKVIIATGGVSYQVSGSDGRLIDGLAMVEKTAWRAGLSPLHTENDFSGLMGISLSQVELHYGRLTIEGELLFTHYGLSGPAALDLSNYLSDDSWPKPVTLDVLPDISRDELAGHLFVARGERERWLSGRLPKRLMQYLIEPYQDSDWANLKKADRAGLLDRFKALAITVNHLGKRDQAIITLGGVALRQLKAKTLEHRTIKGLYFAGECLDIAGPTGGYNLQLAFSTGFLAGRLG